MWGENCNARCAREIHFYWQGRGYNIIVRKNGGHLTTGLVNGLPIGYHGPLGGLSTPVEVDD